MSGSVATRAVKTPAFGAWLERLRGERSLEQIAQKVRPLVKEAGLKVDQSLIYKIEKGRMPSWPMLGALSRVYAVPIKETTERLRASIVFPGSDHLFRQAVSDVQEEERPDDAAASPRSLDADTSRILSELTDACLAFHDLSVTCQDISTRLAGRLGDYGVTVFRRQAPADSPQTSSATDDRRAHRRSDDGRPRRVTRKTR